MNPQIGVITEQNDLGLGFDPLNPNDQKVLSENTTKESDKKESENK